MYDRAVPAAGGEGRAARNQGGADEIAFSDHRGRLRGRAPCSVVRWGRAGGDFYAPPGVDEARLAVLRAGHARAEPVGPSAYWGDEGYVWPGNPVDPTKDKRIMAGLYAVMPSPVDDSVWGTASAFGGRGMVVRIVPGDNPPATTLTEVFNVPEPYFGIRGGDIDKDGVVWVSLGSGHLGSFDRRKCTGPLNGPTATGDHCPEGWTFHRYPGPGFEGIGENSAESSYYSRVDRHNIFGLGEEVPMSAGNLNDGLIAYDRADDRMVTLRVPYPLGFYAKGFDGRIDDPNAGWKGRGLWTTSGDRTPWLMEGGKGSKPLVVHFQMRPDPLAR